MKISILCSDAAHPVNVRLAKWISANQDAHAISLVRRKAELPNGDILFLISCTEIVRPEDRANYRACLVLHASDLPRGRGWSPHIWEIVGGATSITVTLLEAADIVDGGRIWKKTHVPVPRHALWDEINELLFDAEFELLDFAIAHFDEVEPVAQSSEFSATYHPRRTPDDSRIDPHATIESQFDRIRVCDPERYPAFFDLHGHRYRLTVEKISEPDHH